MPDWRLSAKTHLWRPYPGLYAGVCGLTNSQRQGSTCRLGPLTRRLAHQEWPLPVMKSLAASLLIPENVIVVWSESVMEAEPPTRLCDFSASATSWLP